MNEKVDYHLQLYGHPGLTMHKPLFPQFLHNISITTSSVPEKLEDATIHGVLWQAAPGRFLLDVPDVARYLVEGGTDVTIEPYAGAATDAVNRIALTTPLAALLYQRGMLAFHAAAVANEHGVILLAGDSGSGKSTLLMALLQRGWKLLADELAVVTLDGEGVPVVRSTSHNIALWPDTLKKLDRDTGDLGRADNNRLLISMPEQSARPFPERLKSIYWLGIQNKSEITRKELVGTDRFQAIGTMLYNSHIAAALLDRVTYMGYCITLIKALPIVRLSRPRDSWSVNELADVIEADK